MALTSRPVVRSLLGRSSVGVVRSAAHDGQLLPATVSPMLLWRKRSFSSALPRHLPAPAVGGSPGSNATYFQRSSLPANTVIRFVPQQTAWIVERMGKFNRILQPGLAILIPFIDRIAYVQSLKESATEIPSQSAITADNVTLELDGVLYTRVFDAYKARWASAPSFLELADAKSTAMELRTPNMPSLSWRKRLCAQRLDSSPLTTSLKNEPL